MNETEREKKIEDKIIRHNDRMIKFMQKQTKPKLSGALIYYALKIGIIF